MVLTKNSNFVATNGWHSDDSGKSTSDDGSVMDPDDPSSSETIGTESVTDVVGDDMNESQSSLGTESKSETLDDAEEPQGYQTVGVVAKAADDVQDPENGQDSTGRKELEAELSGDETDSASNTLGEEAFRGGSNLADERAAKNITVSDDMLADLEEAKVAAQDADEVEHFTVRGMHATIGMVTEALGHSDSTEDTGDKIDVERGQAAAGNPEKTRAGNNPGDIELGTGEAAELPAVDFVERSNVDCPNDIQAGDLVDASEGVNAQKFQVGDHVYQWCSLLGVPQAFQHHAIVISVESNCEEEDEQVLTVVDFSNLCPEDNETKHDKTCDEKDRHGATKKTRAPEIPHGSFASRKNHCNSFSQSSSPKAASQGGYIRKYKTKAKAGSWHKVQYDDKWYNSHFFRRAGTSTQEASDLRTLVIHRVKSILELFKDSDKTILPNYHAIYANCECFAVWCKTGRFCTLQALSILRKSVAIAAGSTAASTAGIAAAEVTTIAMVPASGVWGLLGCVTTTATTVPLTSTMPMLLPGIAIAGAISAGVPIIHLLVTKKKWEETTKRLNDSLLLAMVPK